MCPTGAPEWGAGGGDGSQGGPIPELYGTANMVDGSHRLLNGATVKNKCTDLLGVARACGLAPAAGAAAVPSLGEVAAAAL